MVLYISKHAKELWSIDTFTLSSVPDDWNTKNASEFLFAIKPGLNKTPVLRNPATMKSLEERKLM